MLITVSKNYGNWGTHLSKNVKITASRKKYEVTLNMPVNDENVRLYFGVGRFLGKFYIDNVSLTQIEDNPSTKNIEISLNKNHFSIYPNPTNGSFTVNFSNTNKMNGQTLQLYSLDGKMLYQTMLSNNKSEINPSHLQPGIYLVKVTSQKYSSTSRLVFK